MSEKRDDIEQMYRNIFKDATEQPPEGMFDSIMEATPVTNAITFKVMIKYGVVILSIITLTLILISTSKQEPPAQEKKIEKHEEPTGTTLPLKTVEKKSVAPPINDASIKDPELQSSTQKKAPKSSFLKEDIAREDSTHSSTTFDSTLVIKEVIQKTEEPENSEETDKKEFVNDEESKPLSPEEMLKQMVKDSGEFKEDSLFHLED